MRSVQSDHILDLVQSAAKVETEIGTHTEEVATRLDERFEPLFEGAEDERVKPDFRSTLSALKDALADSREALTAAEQPNIELIKQAIEFRDRILLISMAGDKEDAIEKTC